MSEQTTQQVVADNNTNKNTKEREISIKERELTLREKELDAKIALDRRGLWLTSPLLIGAITAISGLIGTGIGAVMQGSANFKLERQKFEFALIQEALESPNQKEAAKQLLFLVNSGVILTLDSDNLRKIAEDSPSEIPLLVPNTPKLLGVFFRKYRAQFGEVSPEARAALTKIFEFIERDEELTDIRQIAYILATIKYETGLSYRPLSESQVFRSEKTLEDMYGFREDLGNTEPGDGSLYQGRGYVWSPGKKHYQRMNSELGLVGTDSDLVRYPEKALDPLIAYRILVYQMREGLLTGKKLSDFITDEKTDYYQARSINGGSNDPAGQIAQDAEKIESILRETLEK